MYPRPEEFIGKEVDGHRIDDVLGRGGMGIVFKAENLELSRTVALKIINPALAQDESFLRRFRAEARALAQIHHPNIVIVYDFRSFDMGFYISMEYVKGPTLADYMEEKGAIPWKEGLYLTKQMLSAFHYAHSCGVIHRDIKPRNILLAKNNVVKITDFGLAKILQEGKRTTDTTVTMATGGTIHYMPPEQIRGLRNVDHRGDIFSLGMTIYEAIAGMLPFEKNASGYAIQKMIVEEPFPDIRKRDSSIPKPLARIIMKSLEKEPHKRFQSAAEMISALEEFEMNTTSTALAVNGTGGGNYPGASGFSQRWRLYATLVGLLIVALSFIAVFTPEVLSAFISSDVEEPSLAEQLGTQGDPSITRADAAPLSEIELNPINVSEGPGTEQATEDSVDTTVSAPSENTENPATEPANTSPVTPPQNTGTTTAVGSIRFSSTPEGAQIYLNGVNVGITPLLVDNVNAGGADVELRLRNHESYKGRVQVRPYNISQINRRLAPIMGLLKLNINPPAELYIDGDLIAKETGAGTRVPLLAASHEVLVAHPQHGEWKKTITIAPSDSLSYDIDFTETVRLIITAFDTAENGMHVEILLDGKPTGLYTPTPIEVPIGQHKLAVKAEGYEMVEEAVTKNYEASGQSPIRFVLRKSD
ncbi:MAG: protein kinase [Bacteroidota bacterium]